MDRARCTTDSTIYMAVDNGIAFNRRPDFTTLRNNMVCPACNGRAIFRSEGRDGREACFVGRPHAPGCNQASLVSATAQPQVNTATTATVTRSQRRLIVDFNIATQAAGVNTQSTTQANGPAGQAQGQRVAGLQRDMRRLPDLLDMLIQCNDLRHIAWDITVPGRGDFIVPTFFVNFADAGDGQVGNYHGFWGHIPTIRHRENSLWLNSGDSDDVSVLVDSRFKDQFFQRCGIASVDEIPGSHLLVLGELRRATSNGKKYIEISDMDHFSLKLPR